MRSSWALIAAVLLCGGCSNGDGAAAASTRTEVDAPRILSSADTVRDVRDLALQPSGDVWVLSSFEPHLMLLSPEGTLIARFGDAGAGPAELSNPTGLIGAMGTEGVAVWDPGKGRIQRFGARGAHDGGIPVPLHPGLIPARLEQRSYVNAGRLVALGSGFVRDVYAGQVTGPADLWSGALVRVGREGESVDTIVRFAPLREDAASPPADGSARLLVAPVPLWASCAGRIAILSASREEIVWVDSTGAVAETRAVDLPEILVTEVDKTRFLRQQIALEARERGMDPNSPQMDQMVGQILASGSAVFADQAPPVDLRCGPGGELWVQLFSTEHDPRGFGSTWIRLDPQAGQETVELPSGFAPVVIERDRMWGVHTDELGVERVAVSRIERS